MRALITGATGQLGQACCELLSNTDWDVIGISRSRANWRGSYSVDLTDHRAIFDFLADQDPFDLVIMTHGTQKPATVGDPGFFAVYDEIRKSNLDSAVCLTDALLMLELINPGGLIVYCSSIHAMQPRASRSPYAIAKAGIEALARSVAIEQASRGRRAVALRLGQLEQPMRGIVFTPEMEAAIRERTPLPWVSPVDIAKLCLALYEQRSLSGAILDVDSLHSINIWP